MTIIHIIPHLSFYSQSLVVVITGYDLLLVIFGSLLLELYDCLINYILLAKTIANIQK